MSGIFEVAHAFTAKWEYENNAAITAQMRKEQKRLRDEMARAGTAAHVAEANAALLMEYARAFGERYGLDPVAALSLSEQDGGIDCVDGANVLLRNCAIRNVGKAMLCGNEDEGGGFSQVVMEGCVIESFGRRGPEVKNGSSVLMRRCVIKNWGNPDRFTDRSFGVWAHKGGSIRAESCVFWQDSFFPGGLWQFVKDLAGHIGQCFKDRHFSFRDLFLPGVCRGLTAGPGGFVESVNCYRNKRWIVIEGHQGPWMPEDEAMDAYREKYEKKSP